MPYNIPQRRRPNFCFLLNYLLTSLLTYLLTPCSRVLLEKLTVSQLVKKFSAFYGTRRFITAFTSAHHLSLSLCFLKTLLSYRYLMLQITSKYQVHVPQYIYLEQSYLPKTKYTYITLVTLYEAKVVCFS